MARKTTKNKSETLHMALKTLGTKRPERLTIRKSRDMIFEKFRVNLRTLLAPTTVSMVELSREIGLTKGTRLADLQYGKASPTMEEMMCICKYFKVPMDDIMNKTATITFL